MRRTVIAGNWKMNKIFSEAEDFFINLTEELKSKQVDEVDDLEVIVCPPSLFLELATDFSVESPLSIGGQDVSAESEGAFTGEISAKMLNSIQVDYCIVGHSERRKYHGESDELINRKLKVLLENEVTPIFCLGETLQQREAGETTDVIISQLKLGLQDISLAEDLVIAYEPVWAIGTGKTATPQQAQEIHQEIRAWLRENYSAEIAESMIILYGGSMKPENELELLQQPDIDGGLIGGASLDEEKFFEMIDIAIDFRG
ncbi:MAG: triose-phosphate isomerase [Candidatus Cloacimonadales bacterium]